jgi:hypothetical protein
VVRNRSFYGLVAVSVLLASATGCGRHADSSKNLNNSHVRSLTTLYGLATAKLGHPPGNEKEFKQALATVPLKPEQMKAGSFDELFVSERDGQPLHVVYGTPPTGSDAVVFEQTGVNGKRLVGHRIGMVEEVDEAEYKTLTARKSLN